ncbi:MAG: cobalt-zinc-cadmium efflux system outer membrane protein [Candidatus Omnitrophota bacterium]|jgi:cobalt-zinc-cadmium efflux system outer membrane protein
MKATLILLAFTLTAYTQDGTMEDYLTRATQQHPGLQSAYQEWQASLAVTRGADALPDPTLSFGYFAENVETRVGPQEYKVGISQMIPWFGKRVLKKEAAGAGADTREAMWKADALNVFFDVKSAYHEYHYLKKAIDITRENIDLVKHLEQVAQARIRGGGATSGAIQAQVELGKLDDRLRTMTDMRKPLMARLNAAVNQAIDTELPWPVSPPAHTPLTLDTPALLTAAEQNPMVAAIEARMRMETAKAQLARKAQYPDIMLGVESIQTGAALNPQLAGSGKDPLVGMIALNIPLWPEKNRSRIAESRALMNAASAARDEQVNSLQSALKMAIFNYEDAARKLSLYKDTLIPQAKQSLQVSESAYTNGKADFINVIDAERLLLSFQLGLERARADLEIGKARIEMITAQEWNHE